MDVTFTSLEALILKATQEFLPAPDTAALEAFCAVMKSSPEGPALAAKALASRVQSGNTQESLLALVAVDRCMRRGEAVFHAEVGKFRFLNELIKLVSPKYHADRTPPEVQQRILQSIHAWSIEYPKESKLKVAFDMLRSQGVVRDTPPPLPPDVGDPAPPPPRPRTATFEDDEKAKLLQKLLQSKNPDDLQYANKLIKTLVREEERRTEEAGRRLLETRRGVECARLLGSVLAAGAGADADEWQLARELRETCREHHAALLRLAADTHGDEAALGEILQAIDELTEVFEKYDSVMSVQQPTGRTPNVTNSNGDESLLDLTGLVLSKTTDKPVHVDSATSDIEALSDIFSTDNGLASSEPLKPLSLISTDTATPAGAAGVAPVGPHDALASLGADVLRRALPGGRSSGGFAGKSTKKIPMNAIEKSSPPTETAINSSSKLDLDFLVRKNKEAPSAGPAPVTTPLDDLILDISVTNTLNNTQTTETNLNDNKLKKSTLSEIAITNNETIVSEVEKEISKVMEKSEKLQREVKKSEVAGLGDIEVSLSSVQASSVPPLTLLSDPAGLTVALLLTSARPRPDVRVLVLSTTSRHKSLVSDYKFHAVVPKCCKVRTLSASGSCLPPHSPFLQPAAILQLMLVARPVTDPPVPVQLKYVVTYTCDDETITEMGQVDELPLDQL